MSQFPLILIFCFALTAGKGKSLPSENFPLSECTSGPKGEDGWSRQGHPWLPSKQQQTQARSVWRRWWRPAERPFQKSCIFNSRSLEQHHFCHQKHLTLKTKRRAGGDSVSSPHLWPKFSTTSAELELGILHNNYHFTKECFTLLIKRLFKCNLLRVQSTNLLLMAFVKQSFLFLS